MKNKLDKLVKKYETKNFILSDPIQFPHRFKNQQDIEIAGFIASLFAYGKRELFIKKLNELFDLMHGEPKEFLKNLPYEKLRGFKYRFVKDFDLICLLETLAKLYKTSSLEELFSKGTQEVSDYFYNCANQNCTMGFYHLLPNPKNGGAQKRFNMFLRWMIRDGEVDLGIWNFVGKNKLLIPLDVHVGNVSRKLGLILRRANDFKTVVELTNILAKFDPQDPVKYDFALFGAGVEGEI